MTKRAVTLCVRTEAVVCLTDRASTAEDLRKDRLSMSVKAQNMLVGTTTLFGKAAISINMKSQMLKNTLKRMSAEALCLWGENQRIKIFHY